MKFQRDEQCAIGHIIYEFSAAPWSSWHSQCNDEIAVFAKSAGDDTSGFKPAIMLPNNDIVMNVVLTFWDMDYS